jgi:outer membrane protein OmpA-like peptidoglycan-associated protein
LAQQGKSMTNTPNDPNRTREVHGSSTVQPVGGTTGGAPAPKKSRPWWLWLLPLLLLLGLLFLLLRGCGDDREDEAATTQTTTTTEQSTTVPATGAAPATGATPALPVERVTLPGGQAVELQQGTLNYQLQQYLASPEPAPRRFTFDGLNFATSSAELPADAQSTVTALGQILQAYPKAVVRVEGYADARGSDQTNQQLGAQRAEAVARALIANGIPANRVTAATGGETNPVDSNTTAQGQAENRRTDLVVTAK